MPKGSWQQRERYLRAPIAQRQLGDDVPVVAAQRVGVAFEDPTSMPGDVDAELTQ